MFTYSGEKIKKRSSTSAKEPEEEDLIKQVIETNILKEFVIRQMSFQQFLWITLLKTKPLV